MASPNGKNSIRLRIRNEKNGEQSFKAIITHAMESGHRKDYRTGVTIPADYIAELTVSVDGNRVFVITLGENASPNPFLAFTFSRALVDSQQLLISWVDNLQQVTSHECVVNFNQSDTFEFRNLKEGPEVQRLLPEPAPVCKTNVPGPAQ